MTDVPATADIVRIGIAESAICRSPQKLRTTGLGSCVGIAMYDMTSNIAGMVHIMLPNAPEDGITNPKKYANSGIRLLMMELVAAGAGVSRLASKIAGGAQMFVTAGKNDLMRVGPRNIEAVEATLSHLGIPVVAKDVGGNSGRTIEFDLLTGKLQIRTALNGVYEI